MSSSSSSSVSKRKDESSSQSRLTNYFKPNPEASVLRKNLERNGSSNTKQIGVKKSITQELPIKVTQHTSKVTSISPEKRSREVIANNSVSAVKKRKRVIRDSPIKEELLVKKHEVIAIDLDSSDRDSSLEEELGLSPLKKLMSPKVAKRPEKLPSFLTVSTNLPDLSTKKAGLAMRSPNKSSSVRDNIFSQIAFEEKKNKGKRSAVPDDNVDIIFSPVKKSKRSNSQEDPVKGVKDKIRRKPSVVGNSTSNSVSSHSQMKDENRSKVSNIFAEKLDFEGKLDAAKTTKSTATRSIPEASILTENNVSSSRQRDTKSKRPAASPDFTKKQKNTKEKATETPEKSIPEKRSTSKESAVAAVNIDEAAIKAKPQAVKEAEISEKTSRRIVRRSKLNSTEGVSISSKITVGFDEIQAGAVVAYRETYKDMETLLDLNLDTTICSDFKKALQISVRNLPNDSHVNFKFFMNRKPVNYIDALRALRVDCYQYPHAVDLHIVIHQFLMNVTEHSVLHRALELIYATLGLHPSGTVEMRKYYWSVISRRFDDTDACSRWEILRELLEEVMSADGDDAKRMYIDPNKPTTKLERTRAVLGVIIQVLREDLRCWISLTSEPSAQLRDRNDLPLVARLLWPQSIIPHLNVACRELMDFHLSALKSSNPTNLLYTEQLVKMMTIVTQMSDLQLPLQIRKPGVHMMNLAREIVLRSDDVTSSSFCSSFGSSELELLLPLVILNRLKPQIPIPEGENLSLTWMLNSYLEIDSVKKREEVVARFLSQPAVERNAFLTALSTYFKLFGSFTTWFHMRYKYRNRDLPTPVQQSSPEPPPVHMFSRTFTLSHLMEDLRKAKYLLEVNRGSSKKASLYSSLSGQ